MAVKSKHPDDEFESKIAIKEETDRLVAEYLKGGGKITICPTGAASEYIPDYNNRNVNSKAGKFRNKPKPAEVEIDLDGLDEVIV